MSPTINRREWGLRRERGHVESGDSGGSGAPARVGAALKVGAPVEEELRRE